MEQKRKFETLGKSILIPLNYKGYSVRANIARTNSPVDFEITYEVTCEGFQIFESIDGDTFTINSEKNLNWDTYRFTIDRFAEGYFKPFLDRYNLHMTAMNKGIELLEAERK